MALSATMLSKALASLYDAALDPRHWPSALDAVAHSLDGTGASLVSIGEGGSIDMRMSTSPVDAAARDRYNRHYGQLDEVMARLSRSRVGVSIGCYELIGRKDLLGSEFYTDWLRRIDLGDGIFFILRRERSAMTSLAIGAPLGPESFATAERKRMTAHFVSHIRRAILIQSRLAMADTPFLELSRAKHFEHPVAFVGDGGRLVCCAEKFVGILERAGVSVFRDRILATTFAEQAAIDRALARALRPEGERTGSSLACGLGGPGEISLHVMPIGESLLSSLCLEARALVIAEPRARETVSSAWLRETYGLTEAEVTVALLMVARPIGLQPIARSLDVSVSTVKTHLQRIFEKTGTHRQADLVRLLMNAGVAPRSGGPPSFLG